MWSAPKALPVVLLLAVGLAGCHGTEPLVDPVYFETPPQAQYRIDIQGMGHLDGYQIPDQVGLAWRLPDMNTGTHTAAKGSAAIYDDTIYVGTDAGTLYAIGLDGGILWEAQTQASRNGIHGTPAVDEETVYIGAYEGSMYAYDRATGDLIWRTPIGGSIGSSPRLHEGKIYVSVETAIPSGIVAVLDARFGHILWRHDDLGDHPHSSLALDPGNNTMAVGANDGILYIYRMDPPAFLGTMATGDAIKGPITIYEGDAFFGSWDGHVYRVDLPSGDVVWRYDTGDKVMSGTGIDPDTGTVYVGAHTGRLYALDAATGDMEWAFVTQSAITGSVLVADNGVLFASKDEHLYAVDFEGSLMWRQATKGDLTSTPAIADGLILALDRAEDGPGSLYAWTAT